MASQEPGRDDTRETLDETRRLLRKGVWSMERHPSQPFARHPAAQLLLLWLIEHSEPSDLAPRTRGRWDELGWYPRVRIPGRANASPAERIAHLRGTSRQAQEQLLNRLRDHGLIDFDNGFQNLQIVARDPDDLWSKDDSGQAPDTLTTRPSIRRTVILRANEVEQTPIEVGQGIN